MMRQSRLLSLSAAAALLLHGGISHAAGPQCGDVTGNSQITASDALAALKAAVGDSAALDCGPRGKYLSTGQTSCYDGAGAAITCEGSGQEGAVSRGILRSSVDNEDGTVSDEVTGLMWEKLSDDGTIHDRDSTFTWSQAFDKIDQLNAVSFGGFDDWRLPNAFELLTLVNLGRSNPAYYVAHFDHDCASECTSLECSCVPATGDSWSSTSYVPDPDHAWVVSANDGSLLYAEKSVGRAVRAVRGGYVVDDDGSATGAGSAAGNPPAGSPCGDVDLNHVVTASDALAILKAAVGQPIELRCSPRAETLQTGQTQCYDAEGAVISCAGTGQDGELRLGAPRAFQDNGDGTITDLATGIMWEKLSSDGSIHDIANEYAWVNAFTDKVAGLNTAMFAGYDNWRMPNIFELATLVDLGASDPALYPIFDNNCDSGCTVLTCSCGLAPDGMWSSSTYHPAPGEAWWVDTRDGATGPEAKSATLSVRAVRVGN